MPIVVRARTARALAAVALLGAAVTLSACVSDSQGSAFGPPPSPTSAPLPTVAPSPTVPPIPRNQPVAVVAGTPIPGSDYADLVARDEKTVAFQAQQQPGGQLPTEQQIRSAALTSLIDHAVIGLYARQHGITVTATEAQQRFNTIQRQNGGPITFTTTLQNLGFTVPSAKAFIRDGMLQEKVMQRVTPLPATIEEVRARHILVKSKALADSLYAQLKADPAKFAALARKYSIDTGSARSGGELGFFPRGVMVPPFERAAFTQPIGQIGAPVKSQFGYHIIQVEARKNVPFSALDPLQPPQGTPPQPTQQAYYTQRQGLAFSQWLRVQRQRDGVRVLIKGVQVTP